jgi:hypothetical protein
MIHDLKPSLKKECRKAFQKLCLKLFQKLWPVSKLFAKPGIPVLF